VMTRYWESGAKFDVATYVANSRRGAYEAFYHDAQPRAKGQFKGGRKVGPWTTWHPKGFKESEGSYLPDFYTVEHVPWENRASDDNDKGLYHGIGAKTGRWLYWYAGAERKKLEETYGDDGQVRNASGGLLGPRREWYDNEANSLMSEQAPSGALTTYYENGQVESRCGSSGKCERYDRDGKRTQ
jgi:antitoxin component YwqK of YwqJK toxin-antitoxin module